MIIAENLTEQRFAEILKQIYLKGQESERINITELIEEIKLQVMSEKT